MGTQFSSLISVCNAKNRTSLSHHIIISIIGAILELLAVISMAFIMTTLMGSNSGDMASALIPFSTGNLLSNFSRNDLLLFSTLTMVVNVAFRYLVNFSAVKIGKEAFYKQLEMPVVEAYNYTSEVMAMNMLELDAQEGINAFLEKRVPSWNK